MSAFVLHPEHINVMVFAGLRPHWTGSLRWLISESPLRQDELTEASADRVAQMLIGANVASVNARYGEDEVLVQGYTRPARTDWTAVDLFKAIDCYEYQSCEVGDWEQTEAYAFCCSLRHRIIVSMPGYSDSGAWAIGPESAPISA